jgi:alkylhydroperoxidase family enzyme
MARVTGVYKISDYPGTPDEVTKQDLNEFFEQMFPAGTKPEFDAAHSGWAVMAQNPRLAMHMAKVTTYIARDMPWCKRRDLRELMIQTVNLYYKCEPSFRARFVHAEAAGISAQQQAAIPYWRTSILFDDEQRLVIEYIFSACTGDVAEELFQSVVKQFGETQAIEFTVAVAHWASWAILLNATSP